MTETELRLECIRIAANTLPTAIWSANDIIYAAQELYNFVTIKKVNGERLDTRG